MPLSSSTQGRSAVSLMSSTAADEAVRIRPGSHEARLLLAQARNAAYASAAEGRFGDGVQMLRDALEIEPMSIDLLSDVGALMLAGGQLREAALYAHRAVELSPQHAPSLYTLAFALSALGEIKAAVEVLTTLSQGEPLDTLKRETPELVMIVQTELHRLTSAG